MDKFTVVFFLLVFIYLGISGARRSITTWQAGTDEKQRREEDETGEAHD